MYKNIKHERLIHYLVGAIQHLKLDVENQKNINKQINDELKMTNDELKMTNDELQIINDELQIIKGELKMTNDELKMMNCK